MATRMDKCAGWCADLALETGLGREKNKDLEVHHAHELALEGLAQEGLPL